jgi:hypothetical protein
VTISFIVFPVGKFAYSNFNLKIGGISQIAFGFKPLAAIRGAFFSQQHI